MGKIVAKIPKKYCKNLECTNFAKDLMKKLDSKKIPYEKVELKSNYPYIWSDKIGGHISKNGYHIGIKVGDKVYDNNNPIGMHHSSWYADIFMR
jgi:hypothetical protein